MGAFGNVFSSVYNLQPKRRFPMDEQPPNAPDAAVSSAAPVSLSTPPPPPSVQPGLYSSAISPQGSPSGTQADLGSRLMVALQPPQVSTGRRVLGDIASAIVGPNLGADIGGTGGQRRALQSLGTQYDVASKIAAANRQQQLDASTLGLQTAQTANQNSEAQARLNPPVKQGLTPRETAIHDLMTGNNGQPRTNPATGNPYQYLDAVRDASAADAGAAKATSYEHVTIEDPNRPGQPLDALFDPKAGNYLDVQSKQPIAGPVQSFQRPPEPQKPPQTAMLVPVDPNDPSKGSRVINATPGTIIPPGAKTTSEFGQENKPTVAEQNRADLAENMNENLDQLEDIVTRRPELFGPLAHFSTNAQGFLGTNDKDIGALATIKDNFGKASSSAHGMRNAQSVEKAADALVNGYKNGPAAINSAIQAARNSVKTFTKDVQGKGGSTGSNAGGAGSAGANPSPSPDPFAQFGGKQR